MKKALLLLLSLTLCLSLSACSTADKNPAPNKPDVDTPEEQPGTDKPQEDVLCGNDQCGYITINMYHNVLRAGTNGNGLCQIYVKDSRTLIQWEIINFSKENPDFDFAADYLRTEFFKGYNGDEKIYSNEVETEITLDGSRALRIVAEKKDSKGEYAAMSVAGYVTNNAAGGWVRITITTGKDGVKLDGTHTPPVLSELMEMVEKTFSKTK